MAFYRAMHCRALRGIEIAWCPSVTLVDCDHIGWKSWKLIARTISPTPSLFGLKRHPPNPRENGKMLGRLKILQGRTC